MNNSTNKNQITMTKTITWKFEGLESTFTTPEDKFDVTVNQLRQRNYLAYNHPTIILSDGNTTTTEPVADNIPASNSTNNTKKRKSVSKSAEDTKPVEETTELLPVSELLDDSNSESDNV